MSNIQDQGGASTDAAAPSAADALPLPWSVQRIRRQLYWQAGFALLRASFGVLVIVLVIQSLASLGTVVAAGVFAVGAALAVASIVLARRVTARRRTTRMVIISLETTVAVVYGLLTVQAVAGFASGGALAAVTYNAIGLLIAGSLLRHTVGSAAKAWFNAR